MLRSQAKNVSCFISLCPIYFLYSIARLTFDMHVRGVISNYSLKSLKLAQLLRLLEATHRTAASSFLIIRVEFASVYEPKNSSQFKPPILCISPESQNLTNSYSLGQQLGSRMSLMHDYVKLSSFISWKMILQKRGLGVKFWTLT